MSLPYAADTVFTPHAYILPGQTLQHSTFSGLRSQHYRSLTLLGNRGRETARRLRSQHYRSLTWCRHRIKQHFHKLRSQHTACSTEAHPTFLPEPLRGTPPISPPFFALLHKFLSESLCGTPRAPMISGADAPTFRPERWNRDIMINASRVTVVPRRSFWRIGLTSTPRIFQSRVKPLDQPSTSAPRISQSFYNANTFVIFDFLTIALRISQGTAFSCQWEQSTITNCSFRNQQCVWCDQREKMGLTPFSEPTTCFELYNVPRRTQIPTQCMLKTKVSVR